MQKVESSLTNPYLLIPKDERMKFSFHPAEFDRNNSEYKGLNSWFKKKLAGENKPDYVLKFAGYNILLLRETISPLDSGSSPE